MNIQSRLTKLQNVITGKSSGFCRCTSQNRVFVIEPGLSSEELQEIDAEIEAATNPPEPVNCGECGRELDRRAATFVVEVLT